MSLANAFNHLAPEPPDYQARYQALYFEPIPQSGERFTIGIMAQDETGEARVIQTLADKTLRCLYGNQAEAIQNLVSLILDSARTHLDRSFPMTEWQPPFSGVSVGPVQKTRSQAGIEGVLFQAITSYASLYQGELTQRGLAEHDAGTLLESEDAINSNLIQQVKTLCIKRNPDFAGRWRQEVAVKQQARIIIDYLGVHYNANLASFDVKQISHAFRMAKAKLFDLEVLREKRSHEAIADTQRYELLIALPPSRKGEPNDRFGELETLADSRQLRVVRGNGAEALAARILQSEAA